MYVLCMLGNVNVDNAQNIHVLSAEASADTGMATKLSHKDFVKWVRYEDSASVVRQCDRPSPNGNRPISGESDISSESDNQSAIPNRRFRSNSSPNGDCKRPGMTREEVIIAKRTQKCRRYETNGHWYGDNSEKWSV